MKNRSANDEAGEIVRQEHLFRLKDIKSQAQLEEVDKGEMAEIEGEGGLWMIWFDRCGRIFLATSFNLLVSVGQSY